MTRTETLNSKMGPFDDPRFNHKFVAVVEMHSWLYDTTHPHYAMSEKVDEGWQSVVDQLGGGVTIQDCKARWRNIRGRFTKFIKAYSEDSSTTPYYLASSLRFVLPFMKNRVCLTEAQYEQIGTDPVDDISDNSYLFTPSVTLSEVEIIESSDESEVELKPTCIIEPPAESLPIQQRRQSVVDENQPPVEIIPIRKRRQSVFSEDRSPADIPQPSRKRRQSVVEPEPSCQPIAAESTQKRPRLVVQQESQPATSSSNRSDEVLVNSSLSMIDFDVQAIQRDCDVMFLLSLLPDFKNMNERQKRKFKAGVMNLTFDIMEES